MTPADTSVQTIVMWLAAFTTMFSFGSLLWTIFSGPSRRNSAKLETHEVRLMGIEQTLRMMPAKQELHDLELVMARLQGEMKTMSETMRGQSEIMRRVEALVGRHEDHLLKK